MKRVRMLLVLALSLIGVGYFAATTKPFPFDELIGAVALAALAVLLLVRGTSRSTRVAKYLAWVNAIGGLLWAMAFAPDMFAGAWLAGVFAFGLIVSLQSVLWQPAKNSHG